MKRMALAWMLLVVLSAALTPKAFGADVSNAPEQFPGFYFKGREEEARLLSCYLWYHYMNRLHNSKVMFNKEYLTLADSWLGGATYTTADTKEQVTIQDQHRNELTNTRIDAEPRRPISICPTSHHGLFPVVPGAD